MILTKVKAPELMQEGSKFFGRELILLFRPKLTAVPPLALMTGLSEFKQLPSFLKKKLGKRQRRQNCPKIVSFVFKFKNDLCCKLENHRV